MNSTNKNHLEFSLEWQALKLLGKSLYSNPWAAISELAANGIDAGANKIYIHLNFSKNKKESSIEILDNGSGMSLSEMENYIKIGFNKRNLIPIKDRNNKGPMGRKGIGKLSALYLSDHYIISTKSQEGDISHWEINVEAGLEDSSKPRLERIDSIEDMKLKQKFESFSSGTYLQILNVDFTGIGRNAVDALPKKIANQFILGGETDCKIYLCISDNGNCKGPEPVTKDISFKNFIVFRKLSEEKTYPTEVRNYISSKKNKVGYYINGRRLRKEPEILESNHTNYGKKFFTDIEGNKVEIDYKLTGWLALHASINVEKAQENDKTFKKNKFYSPCQIRLYVRDKLAIENISPLLGINQATLNYIEGEVSFDVLDLDNLPDIATTNRQGFDENDPRFELLLNLVRDEVRSLINKRKEILEQGIKEIDNEKSEKQRSAKREFTQEVTRRMNREDISKSAQGNILQAVELGLKSEDIEAKENYKIFISHASKDKSICDILFWMLKKQGVREEEIFYTSKNATKPESKSLSSLSEDIKEWITSSNTKIVYVTSNNFMVSEYCMFEGGAGWATRGTDDYSLLPTEYGRIPDFLIDGRKQACITFNKDNPSLDRNNYFLFINIINELIKHVNKGRSIKKEKMAIEIDTEIPDDPNIEDGKNIKDYMDKNFVKFWELSKIDGYSK